MLLQKLKEYYDAGGSLAAGSEADATSAAAPAEYERKNVPWVLRFDGGSATWIRTSDGKGAKADRGLEMLVPALKRSGQKWKPQLLADKLEVLGRTDSATPARSAELLLEFRTLIEGCARVTGLPALERVAAWLAENPLSPPIPDEAKASDYVTFEVDGVRLIDLPEVRAAWALIAPQLAAKGSTITVDQVAAWCAAAEEGAAEAATMQCLVCGEFREPARIHPVDISIPRPVADQQLKVVSANNEAFLSYGLEQSLIAPTCRECARAYARALNDLVRNESTRLVVGSTITLFWTRSRSGFSPLSFLDKPEPGDVKSLLESVAGGGSPAAVDADAFYATTLTASGSRVAVRDWIDTTVGDAKASLARWFQAQRMADEWHATDGPPLGAWSLCTAILPIRGGKADFTQLPRPVPRTLFRAALAGSPLPMDLLQRAVLRARSEQQVRYATAVLIRLVLVTRHLIPEDSMSSLAPDNPNSGYQCGRLLAVLEEAQRAANPNINATIVDRFYGTASSAPASVFPRLLRGVQPHLAKLERDRPGTYRGIQRRVEEVLDEINGRTGFPRTLTTLDQGLFALGYYHQRAASRAEARAAADARRAGATNADTTQGESLPEEE